MGQKGTSELHSPNQSGKDQYDVTGGVLAHSYKGPVMRSFGYFVVNLIQLLNIQLDFQVI